MDQVNDSLWRNNRYGRLRIPERLPERLPSRFPDHNYFIRSNLDSTLSNRRNTRLSITSHLIANPVTVNSNYNAPEENINTVDLTVERPRTIAEPTQLIDDVHFVNNIIPPIQREFERISQLRAEAHPETYDELNHRLVCLFVCTICSDYIFPPIYQCRYEHLVCISCLPTYNNCPTCYHPFFAKHNQTLEKVGRLLKFPCSNELIGCTQKISIALKQIHEEECPYRQYACFFTGCAWKGCHSEIHAHMVNHHNNFILTGLDQAIDIMMNISNQTHNWFLVAQDKMFAVIAHTSTQHVEVIVHFIGQAVKSKQFKFTIMLTGQRGDSSQKLIFENSTIPLKLHDDYNGSKKGIFSFPCDFIEAFVKPEQHCLPIMLKITPVD